MKTKGYISVFALIISLLLFALITVILIGVDFENKINRNQKDYYQNCLISESIFNKLQHNENTMEILEEIFKKLNVNTGGERRFTLEYNEILKGGSTEIKVITNKDGKYHLSYEVKYKNTVTNSNITYSKEDNLILNKEEIIKLEGNNEIYDMLLNNEFERIEGDIVVFTYEDKNYFILVEECNRVVEEFNNSEDEDKDFKRILFTRSMSIEKDKLYFINTSSINIEEAEDFNISGVFINNGNITGEGKININGILINRDKNSENFIVNGKVIEEESFNGKVRLENNILKKINNSLKIEDKFILENYYIQ